MALSRVKNWIDAEILTHTDINAEFNSILDNANSLDNPWTASYDADGFDLTDLDELEFRDAAANASAVGRLRRNDNNLTWHDRTGAVPVQTLVGGLIFGLTMSNAADADHDITVAVGSAVDSTEATTIRLTSAITKQIDAAWAVGTNLGGLFTGAVAADTWYHVFVIRRNDTGVVDAGFDTSVTAANIPANYNVFRRIGSVRTDVSSNIIGFSQVGDSFLWNANVVDLSSTDPGITATLQTLTVPTGVVVDAIFSVHLRDTTPTAVTHLRISAADQANTAAGSGDFDLKVDADAEFAGTAWMRVRTDTSARIRWDLDQSTADHVLQIFTKGWVDSHGRDS